MTRVKNLQKPRKLYMGLSEEDEEVPDEEPSRTWLWGVVALLAVGAALIAVALLSIARSPHLRGAAYHAPSVSSEAEELPTVVGFAENRDLQSQLTSVEEAAEAASVSFEHATSVASQIASD
jgi:hypothetical protein